jgi:hypothetical protein
MGSWHSANLLPVCRLVYDERMRRLLAPALLLAAWPVIAGEKAPPEVRKIAETYLKALTSEGDESGRSLLLGGATTNAQLASLENWRIVSEDPVQREQGELSSALHLMAELDEAGRAALNQVLDSTAGAGIGLTQISQAEAARLQAPTREKAQHFEHSFPVLAYVTRVGKDVYWNPKNPARAMLASAGKAGPYTLEMYLFHVETREGPRQVPREWPLRVLRFKTAKLDTGWKILPASDWNAE